MANYREVEIRAPESIATAGSKRINLDVTEPITRLDVIWKKTNSNRTPIAHPGLIVSRLEVIDGSDVLFSMPGSEAVALAYYKSGLVPGIMINYELGQWSMVCASIYFGRHMWDEKLALDPRRFSNLQIKIAHNLALGGSTGTVADLSVYAHVFDEKQVQPIGFLQAKEIYSYLGAASSWYYIDMPSDHQIRAVMFGCDQATEGPDYEFEEFKIEEAQGKRVIMHDTAERYCFQAAARDPLWGEHVILKPAAAATDLTFYGTPHWERRFVGNVEGTAYAIAGVSNAGCLFKVQNATAAAIIEGWIFGHCPFGQLYIPFGEPEGMEFWDVNRAGSGKLSIKNGASSDTDEYVRVFVDQCRKY